MLDGDETARIVVAQRPEENGVDRAEDRRIGPDAEREGENDDEGERRALEQAAKAIADILKEAVHDLARGWGVAGNPRFDETTREKVAPTFNPPRPRGTARW